MNVLLNPPKRLGSQAQVCVCLKVVFSYTSGSDHFLSGVDCLPASWALIRATKLLGQLGRVCVGGGLVSSSSERGTMN